MGLPLLAGMVAGRARESTVSCNEDILLNGTRLTKVVTDGLPAGVTAALEFKITGSGKIQN
jgi:hypothetical protein